MKDFHIHSGLIDHTHDDIISIAKKAKELGFSEITILEHISPFKIKFPNNSDPSNTIFIDKIPKIYPRRTSTVNILIEQCKKAKTETGIKINKSLEVDYHKSFENEIKKYLKLDIDYLTLSSHYVEDPEADKKNKLIHIGFIENMKYFLNKYGEEKLYELYFKNQMNGVRSGLFKLVAHLDFFGRLLKDYNSSKIMKYVEPMLKEIIKRNMYLEINLAKDTPQPAIEIIKKYKEFGGNKLCLSSDSHSIVNLEKSLGKREKILKEIDVDIE
jgi:HisJ family histidinol phosphate phosphatase